MSLKQRLLLFVSVLLLVAIGVLSALAYQGLRSEIVAGVQQELAAAITGNQEALGRWVAHRKDVVEATAVHLATVTDPVPYLLVAKSAGRFDDNVFAGYPDKRMIYHDVNTKPPAGFDPTARPWYLLSAEKKTTAITAPYVFATSKKLGITVTRPIMRDGQMQGAVGANMTLEEVIKVVKGIKLRGDGYAFLATRDGKIVAHPAAESTLKSVGDVMPGFAAALLTADTRETPHEIPIGGRDKYVQAAPISGTDWVLGTVVDKTTILAPAQALLMVLAAAGLLVGVLGVIVANVALNRLLRDLGGEPAVAVEIAKRMAAGDLTTLFEVRAGDTTSLMASMKATQASVQALVTDAAMLAEAAVAGQLSTRADASKHQGDFGRVVSGVNDTLDAVIRPLNVAATCVEQISRGEIPPRIDESYQGDFNTLKNNLNVCIDSVNALLADANVLTRAAMEGKLDQRADAARHHGDFRKVVEGMNQTLDAMAGPVNEVARVLAALARGDLTEKISARYQGTFDELKNNANTTVEQLTGIVGSIKESVEAINVASKEIASGNTDLSQRTEEQASNLEQTAASTQELTGTVKQNAENAKQANQLAAGASDVASRGGEVVKQVVATMSGISASSKKIADIISVIDGIAFQTNILALNAAVEAARAGEQGRGFAVVATEVRNLAQRSAAAAKEIKDLITDSVDKVHDGTRLVDEAGKTMDEIVTSVKRVTDIMSEIMAASQEQSTGIEQVNQAITQMDQVTQQNAALVEEAAAAAESLEEQARSLAQAVAVFKVAQVAASSRPAGATTRVTPKVTALPAGRAAVREIPRAAAPRPAAARSGAAAEDKWEEF